MDRVFGAKRLTGTLLDRLVHHVNFHKMDLASYCLGQSCAWSAQTSA